MELTDDAYRASCTRKRRHATVLAFGRARVFLYLPHPAGPKKKCFIDGVQKERLEEIRDMLTNSTPKKAQQCDRATLNSLNRSD